MTKKGTNQRDVIQVEGMSDPVNQRRNADGKRRLHLNAREKLFARKRQLASRVAAMIATLPYDQALSSILEQNGINTGEVANLITDRNAWDNDDTEALRNEVRKRISGMYLDIDRDKPFSNADIAAAVGISTISLRKIVSSEEFQAIYNENFFRAVSDPRIKAVQEATAELAPLVFTTLKDLLTRRATSDTVRLRAATFLAEHLGLVKEGSSHSDRNELAKFLGERNLSLTNITINNNIGLTPEFMQEVEKFMPKEKTVLPMIDGEFDSTDIPVQVPSADRP